MTTVLPLAIRARSELLARAGCRSATPPRADRLPKGSLLCRDPEFGHEAVSGTLAHDVAEGRKFEMRARDEATLARDLVEDALARGSRLISVHVEGYSSLRLLELDRRQVHHVGPHHQALLARSDAEPRVTGRMARQRNRRDTSDDLAPRHRAHPVLVGRHSLLSALEIRFRLRGSPRKRIVSEPVHRLVRVQDDLRIRIGRPALPSEQAARMVGVE